MKKTLRVFAGLAFMAALASLSPADIALTTTEQVRSEIGGAGAVSYDRLRMISIVVTPPDTIVATVELFLSSDASKPALRGTYTMLAGTSIARLEIERLGLETGVSMTAGQVTTVQNHISSHVADIEAMMITLGLAAGVQQ